MGAAAQDIPAPNGPPNIVSLNNEAADSLSDKEGNAQKAYQLLMQALQSDPFNPVVRLNIGMFHLKEELIDKAIKDFLAALRHFGGDDPKKWMDYQGDYKSNKKSIYG